MCRLEPTGTIPPAQHLKNHMLIVLYGRPYLETKIQGAGHGPLYMRLRCTTSILILLLLEESDDDVDDVVVTMYVNAYIDGITAVAVPALRVALSGGCYTGRANNGTCS